MMKHLWTLFLVLIPASLADIYLPKPTCEDPVLNTTTQQFRMKCGAQDALPVPKCSLFQTTPGPSFSYNVYKNSETSSTYPERYNYDCNFVFDAKNLASGVDYQFYVTTSLDGSGVHYETRSLNTSAIQYNPVKVDNFTVNGEDECLEVDEGSNIMFVCSATGALQSNLGLFRGYSASFIYESQTPNALQHELTNVQCSDTNEYRCRAATGDSWIESVRVYVKCPGQNRSCDSDPVKISRFTINGEAKCVEVDEGSDITFSCDAAGDPQSTLGLFLGTNSIFKSPDLNTLQFSSGKVGCGDTNVYTCRAVTGESSTESVQLYVKCAGQTGRCTPDAGGEDKGSGDNGTGPAAGVSIPLLFSTFFFIIFSLI